MFPGVPMAPSTREHLPAEARFRGASSMNVRRLPAAVAAFLAAAVLPVKAATLRVPGQFGSIQSAIEAAAKGDTVSVSPGTFRERLRLKTGIIVRSEGDDAKGTLGLRRAESTTLDCPGGSGPGVEMAKDATLDGFTITGVGKYDDALWLHHFDTRGNEQEHESIGGSADPGISAACDCAVLNNIVHHIGSTGIAIAGAPGVLVSPRLAGNICYRNMGGGIGVMQGAAGVVERNVCFENFHAGIGCDAASPAVRDNICRGNIRAGIGISNGASPQVVGNRCFENRRAGIGIRTGRATRPLVERNECADNGMAGIGVEEGARPILLKNRLTGNKLVAIGVTGGSEATIRDNELVRDGGAPPMIAVLDDSSALITGNTIRGGGVAGILVKGKAVIRGNDFTGNGPAAKPPANNAIWAQAGAEVTMGGNRVEGWKRAVNRADGASVKVEKD
jgi:hypothetical protein